MTLGHWAVLPVIAPGIVGSGSVAVTVRLLAVPVPHELDGVTVMLPIVDPAITVTEFPVPPPVCIHPEGKVQV